MLIKRMSYRRVTPIWRRRAFVRHIVFGLSEPVSLCGRFVGDVSTAPMPAIIGVRCPVCIHRWNRAVVHQNADTDALNEKAIVELADELDELIGSGDLRAITERWNGGGITEVLQRAVRERLDERGVDVKACLQTPMSHRALARR